MITIFSFGDTIGRFLADKIKIFTPYTIGFFTSGRLVFIATSVLIQLKCNPGWLFQSDWFKILHIWLVAATNGYNAAAAMLMGPQQVRDVDKERAGMIMNFHLIGGVCIGTLFAAFVMDKI